MNLTRRGYGLVGAVVVAEVFAVTSGARAINAVAAPLVVALLAAAVQVSRTEAPLVDRSVVRPGFPGDTREVVVEVAGSGVATVTDHAGDGVTVRPDPTGDAAATTHSFEASDHSGEWVSDASSLALTRPTTTSDDEAVAEATLPAVFAYGVTLERRGRHTLGPVDVAVTDVLGLVEQSYEFSERTTALVYPPVYQVAGREEILREVVDRDSVERHEFDAIREYAPGDPLRDVHWKSTAKDPEEMYVTEFADRRVEDTVVVGASCEAGSADEMAAAAASIAVMSLDADISVELRAPSATVPMGSGTDHRDRILKALALTDGGHPAESELEGVDIHVHASAEGVTVSVGSRTRSLSDLTVSRENPLADREVAT